MQYILIDPKAQTITQGNTVSQFGKQPEAFLKEVCEIIGCETFEPFRIREDHVLLIDEDARLKKEDLGWFDALGQPIKGKAMLFGTKLDKEEGEWVLTEPKLGLTSAKFLFGFIDDPNLPEPIWEIKFL